MPDRETPGRERERLREPHDDRVPETEVTHRLRLSRAVGPVQKQRAGCEQDEDLPGLAEVVGDGVLADETCDAGRNRGDEDEPRDPLVGRCDAPASDRADPRAHQPDDVAPEVGADGDERAEVERDVERLVEAVVLLEVRPLGCPRDEDQVAGRRDRQELRQALDDPEDERLPVRECRRVVPHSGEREDDGEAERGTRDAEYDGAAHGEILRSKGTPTAAEEKRRKLRQSGERATLTRIDVSHRFPIAPSTERK